MRQFEESPEEVAAWKAKKEPLVSDRTLTAIALLWTCATAKRTRDFQAPTINSTKLNFAVILASLSQFSFTSRNIFLKGLNIVPHPNRCFIRVQLDGWLSSTYPLGIPMPTLLNRENGFCACYFLGSCRALQIQIAAQGDVREKGWQGSHVGSPEGSLRENFALTCSGDGRIRFEHSEFERLVLLGRHLNDLTPLLSRGKDSFGSFSFT